ncbi:MAG TPA: aldehyde dehydrogenase family protein [Phycisphaerales bacterium]|nr:aldehyde dehydrogenase family protein [Phycisphaerales bacterium]
MLETPAKSASKITNQFMSFVDGKFVDIDGAQSIDNINPADGSVVGKTYLMTAEQCEAAIQGALKAFESWRMVPAPKRAKIFAKFQLILEERKEELARALTEEEGKRYPEALGEVQKAINIVEFMVGEGRRFGGRTIPSEMENTLAYTVRQPLGVVGLITPWNFPVAIPVWKMLPALIAGNTAVFKPATNTTKTACMLAEMLNDAGLPPGVLQLTIGRGSSVGETIVHHPKVMALSFTGSNPVGQKLYQDGAARGIKVQCEMGGKNPIVVLDDADVDLAVEATAQGAFGSTGQRCTATSRAIVTEAIADEFVKKLVARAKTIRIGNGMDADTDMGPIVDDGQMQSVVEGVEKAKADSRCGQLLLGGERAMTPPLDKGTFFPPTIFDHVDPDSFLAQEELFGPVLAVIRVKDFEEAIKAANNVAYGLSSSVYTKNTDLVFRFLDLIETGITHVNSPTMGGEAQLPFGGVKATGVGAREMGTEGVEFFTELKTVYIDYTGQKREGNLY